MGTKGSGDRRDSGPEVQLTGKQEEDADVTYGRVDVTKTLKISWKAGEGGAHLYSWHEGSRQDGLHRELQGSQDGTKTLSQKQSKQKN